MKAPHVCGGQPARHQNIMYLQISTFPIFLDQKQTNMLMEILAEDQKSPEAENTMGYKGVDRKALLESYMDFLSSKASLKSQYMIIKWLPKGF